MTSHGFNILDPVSVVNAVVGQSVQIVAAVVVLLLFFVLGLIVAFVVNKVLAWLLNKSKANEFFDSVGLKEAFGRVSINWVIHILVDIYIVLAFLGAAVQLVNVNYLVVIVSQVLGYIPLLVQGLLVLLLASVASKYAERVLEQTHFVFVKQLSVLVTLLVFYLAVVIALPLFLPNINVSSLLQLLQLFVAAIVVAVGLGFGLAMGLGLKDSISKAALKNQALFDQLFEGVKKRVSK